MPNVVLLFCQHFPLSYPIILAGRAGSVMLASESRVPVSVGFDIMLNADLGPEGEGALLLGCYCVGPRRQRSQDNDVRPLTSSVNYRRHKTHSKAKDR